MSRTFTKSLSSTTYNIFSFEASEIFTIGKSEPYYCGYFFPPIDLKLLLLFLISQSFRHLIFAHLLDFHLIH